MRGKVRKFSRPVWVTGDHPRLCGEKQRYELGCKAAEGSPPPMRGKALLAVSSAKVIGITPAYAGKS